MILELLWPRVMATEFGRRIVGQTVWMLQILGVLVAVAVVALLLFRYWRT